MQLQCFWVVATGGILSDPAVCGSGGTDPCRYPVQHPSEGGALAYSHYIRLYMVLTHICPYVVIHQEYTRVPHFAQVGRSVSESPIITIYGRITLDSTPSPRFAQVDRLISH